MVFHRHTLIATCSRVRFIAILYRPQLYFISTCLLSYKTEILIRFIFSCLFPVYVTAILRTYSFLLPLR